jgi:glucokinase
MNIAFDIGGTSLRVAAVTSSGIGEPKKVPTPQDPKEAVQQIATLAKDISGGAIEAAAGGIRGRVVDGVFLKDKILVQWEGTKLVDELSQALGAPVQLVHDTAVAGLGEVHYGAGRGSKICAYITVSTGVGGDRIVDGHVDHYTYNPEIGRQLIDGTELEGLISGTAVQKKFGVHPKDLDSLDERNKLAGILAIGLYHATLHWSPDTIVLGGSMIIGVNPIPLARVQEELTKRITMYPKAPVVKMAELGDSAGLYGGVALLQERR